MSLRWKIAFVGIATAVAIVIALYFVSQSIFMRGFQAVEDSSTIKAIEALAGDLSDRIQALHTLNHDWAAWDDTYAFVQNPEHNRNYVESNPTDTTFASAKLNLIAILDQSNHVAFAEAFDLESDSAVPVPDTWQQYLYTNRLLHHTDEKDSVSGIVLLPEGPMLVSSQPIITSQGEGPVKGTIIMAQLLDSYMISSISNRAHMPLDVAQVNGGSHSPDIEEALLSLSTNSPTSVRPMDTGAIAGYELVNDIYGKPALVLRTSMPRDIHASAVSLMRSFFLALLLMGLIVVAVLHYVLGKLVISKVNRIGGFLSEISKSGDLTPQIPVSGSDELAHLARDVNNMVNALHGSEQALHAGQEAEQQLRLTIESVVEGIATTSAGGMILDVNESKVQLHGYSNKEELIGKNMVDLIDPEDRERASVALRDTAQTGWNNRGEYRMLRRDGTVFYGERAAAGLRGPDGKTTGFVISTRDVTDRRIAADQLEKLNQDLQALNTELEAKVAERTQQLEQAVVASDASNQAKSEFLASMSHELRTPLNAIIGFSQMLQEQFFGNLNEKQMEYVVDVLDSGKHLLSLINDILDLSKIEAGKMELEISNVKIGDIIKGSLIMIKEKALAHGITLEVESSDDTASLEIPGDERRLKQVMFNLLSNAAKFTPDGGNICIHMKKDSESLSVSVSDTGIGLTPDEQGKLFQAFYQASGGLKDKTPGTGLGLTITKSIVEKHGGHISVKSEGRGKGSRFTFTLPLESRSAAFRVGATANDLAPASTN